MMKPGEMAAPPRMHWRQPKAADERAVEIEQRFQELDGWKQMWVPVWTEIAERVQPKAADFDRISQPGDRRTSKMYDATAALALDRYAAANEHMLVPRNALWHGFSTSEEELDEDPEVAAYLSELRRIIFKKRYAPSAGFAMQMNEVFLNDGAFGTATLFIDEDRRDGGSLYKSVPLKEGWIATDERGRVDTFYRKFPYTARQILRRFGEEALPPKVRRALEQNKPLTKFELIHAVEPRDELERDRDRFDWRGMPWTSDYLVVGERWLLERGGYQEFPYPTVRSSVASGEMYGRGPAMLVLPDIKSLNAMMRTTLGQGERALNPTILLWDEASRFKLNPGGMVFGGMSKEGRPLAAPLETRSNFQIGLELMDQKRKVINEAFLVTLFQILVDEGGEMTATEALLRAQEKGALLAPAMGRKQSELLGPMIKREVGVMSRQGHFPEPPGALIEAGGIKEITYESPMVRAQKAEGGEAVARWMQMLGALREFDPAATHRLDADEAALYLAREVYGVPPELITDDETVAQRRQGDEEAMLAEQALAAAPVAAAAAKELSAAQSVAGNVPQPIEAAPLGLSA